ncbi:MAG: hypothetical protein E2O44_04410 [Nitrospina sp.]|nr:MAG: hypothetical protein E2O44_04410 [Nitrospina sp.]TDJ58182.1 MAG: hypothetical protein E2O41_06565 [Nitrospina sp.]
MTPPQEELPPLKVLLTHLEWNLKRMEEFQKEQKTDYFRDAALQRYGFTFDSALKCIRAGAHLQNLQCETAEECFGLAKRQNWLEPNIDWQEMVTAHAKMNPASLPEHADTIYEKLRTFQSQLKNLYHSLAQLA